MSQEIRLVSTVFQTRKDPESESDQGCRLPRYLPGMGRGGDENILANLPPDL